jgi:uncharacterized membrane protein YoaK (UPF0700 family)
MATAPNLAVPATTGPSGDGPLPALLMVLTAVTGLVDAVSYLKLGHVFVANMTGNVAFLGFAVADAREFSVAASLTATVAFLAGAAGAGQLARRAGAHRGRLLAIAVVAETVLFALAASVAAFLPQMVDRAPCYLLIVLLALAMGVQNAVARKLGVADLTTTVLTMTLTGLAADSSLGGGNNPRSGRRLMATACIFMGAAIGTAAIFLAGVAMTLGLAVLTLAGCAVAAARAASSSDPWVSAAA